MKEAIKDHLKKAKGRVLVFAALASTAHIRTYEFDKDLESLKLKYSLNGEALAYVIERAVKLGASTNHSPPQIIGILDGLLETKVKLEPNMLEWEINSLACQYMGKHMENVIRIDTMSQI